MKKNHMLIIICVGAALIILGIIISLIDNKDEGEEDSLKEDIKTFIYEDNKTPPISYDLSINNKTKQLSGSIYYSCSYLDCVGNDYQCSTKLTDNEYKNIMILWDDKATLSSILDSICKGEEIMYKSFEESHEESIEDYNKMDTNSDGKVTHREFANQWLEEAIKEK